MNDAHSRGPWDVVFEPVHPLAQMPQQATPGSAGYDAVAAMDDAETLLPHATALVPLGFKARMPQGLEAQIRPRSGLAWKHGVTVMNAPGTIDSDYPGEWKVMLVNHTDQPFVIRPGDRVAQIVFALHETVWFIRGTVEQQDREGGFGSTGR